MKTKDTPKQYVIYSRKSKFTGKGESIENQIELCRRFLAMHFGEDAAENVLVYEDEGFSGGNLERPQFKKMMKDSQKIAFAASTSPCTLARKRRKTCWSTRTRAFPAAIWSARSSRK